MRRVCILFLTTVLMYAVLGVNLSMAVGNCGSIPQEYKHEDFGGTLYSLKAPCNRTLSTKEQVFVAGLSQYLLTQCGYPSDLNSRMKLQKFLTSSALVGVVGSQYGNPDLGKGLGDQMKSGVAYAVGEKAGKSIGCNTIGKKVANNIVSYIERTSTATNNGPNYVAGCASYYSGRYSKKQCQCIADIGRSVSPNIHNTRFSSSSIKRIIDSNPFVGLQIAFQCGIGDY